MNIAIIGCGRIAPKHMDAICKNQKNLCLKAVCDVVYDRAKHLALEYVRKLMYIKEREKIEIPTVYTNYLKMLDNERIDIVAICTESGNHAAIAIKCMEAGKHVIVEKPMALSIIDAERMICIAESRHVWLGVCHQNRFNPPIQKLRNALEKGRFGRIIAGNARILWNRDENYYRQATWRGTYKQDGGCLMNQCIHNIDLLQWMLGSEMKWINGVIGNYSHPYIEAEDYGSIQIKFSNGAIGNVEGTVCTYPKNLEETLTIIGEQGTVSIGGVALNNIETWDFADGLDTFEQVVAECNCDVENVYGNGHVALYTDFVDAVYNNRKPYIDGKEGEIGMEIILAAYKSNKEMKRIFFPIENIKSEEFCKKTLV